MTEIDLQTFQLHQIDYGNQDPRQKMQYEEWSKNDIDVLADAAIDSADRLEAVFERYRAATTLFVVTSEDEFCGAMRLACPSEGVNNPTVDYLNDGEWMLSEGDIHRSLAKIALDVNFGQTVDILSFSIKERHRKHIGDKTDVNYFAAEHGINVIFFQALYNWCKENNMQWITAMYATERARPLLRAGLMQRFPDIEDKEIGGTLSTPIIGQFSVWQQIVENTATIREGVFSKKHEVDKVRAA
jgi:hypothetical protein